MRVGLLSIAREAKAGNLVKSVRVRAVNYYYHLLYYYHKFLFLFDLIAAKYIFIGGVFN